MRLLLIRHGETVDNAAGIYAGITDSALTNHGVLQAQRLGTHLATTGVKISHIFSSDLQRAVNTAAAVRSAQSPTPPATKRLEILREQDFGFYEGKPFSERPRGLNKTGKEAHLETHSHDLGFKDVESKQAMAARMDTFVELHLVPLFTMVDEDKAVVVVAHGIILSHLWRDVLKRFPRADVHVVPGAVINDNGRPLEHLGSWSNTGYLELHIKHYGASANTSLLSTEPILSPLAQPSMKRKLSQPFCLGQPLPAKELPDLIDVADSSSVGRVREDCNIPPSAKKKPTDLLAGALLAKPPTVPTPPSANPPLPRQIPNMSLVVKAVNNTEHLRGLKRTRGGIGSLKHDSSQKTVDSFFAKKQRTE